MAKTTTTKAKAKKAVKTAKAPAKSAVKTVAKTAAKTAGKSKTASKSKAPSAKQAPRGAAPASQFPVKPGELRTLFDFVRYAVSRFAEADLAFAHGTTDPLAEAAFLVCDSLNLHPEQFDMFAMAHITAAEAEQVLDVIHRRVTTRKPAAYLVNKAYMLGLPFYIDERAIVPRSFIGEIFGSHFDGGDGSLIEDPEAVESVLDLCTGSGCLAVLASQRFPNARIDAVDLSPDALEVAAHNVDIYELQDHVTLYQGDLFAPLADTRYDLIISNPPYVDAQGMDDLPDECRFEPEMALDGGLDGLDVVRRILAEAKQHLTPQGGLLCEIGRGRELIENEFPQLPLLWLDTEESDGEVFWIAAADLEARRPLLALRE
ncbi:MULTISPECIES: 50S ribosomal protein L3 N(5)-glutamine methyltransferase [Rhodopseudomonas]|uniref:50S ribosomal protein L3 N(5)-glutamine methyltransferase n=1 Tax=Rhodopseudomonas TaxID=1073 RepID=UPI0009BB5CF9|nr:MULTISPECIES: 50S ribosomal protein L3 N(5)-glutamine methyltransferase [Rhodopseudomonas]MDF3811166.1 50S ribosomal protein L3 N(5)-glutamine methyltransferase [Rhodopseudomonas sp. BAL398]WOK17448.1 50S ribosomal protein L3 N(5)-glutamine methyltransferase [Rhodopseudomonas sp. BAL398]